MLSNIGPNEYSLIRTLVAPTLPKDKINKELVDAMQTHLAPKPLVISERFRFYKRDQKTWESISQYSAEISKLSGTCDFGDSLDQALRDKLVCGLLSDRIQNHLLTEDHSFQQAHDKAVGMESAQRDTKEFAQARGRSSGHTGSQVYKMFNPGQKPQ